MKLVRRYFRISETFFTGGDCSPGDWKCKEESLRHVVNEGKASFDKAIESIKSHVPKQPTADQMATLVKEQSEKLADGIRDIGLKAEKTIRANPDTKTFIANVQSMINETADKLKKDYPKAAQDAEKLGESMKETWETLQTNIESKYKEYSKENGKLDEIDDLLKKIADKGNAVAKELEIRANLNTKTLIANVQSMLKENADKLKKDYPKISQDAEKLGESMKKAWETLQSNFESKYKEYSKNDGKLDKIDDQLNKVADKGNAVAKELQEAADECKKK